MLTLATCPDHYPRSKRAGQPSGNVFDPDGLIMGPDEWKEFSEGSEEQSSNLAVSGSDLGLGVLTVTKKTFTNGQYIITAQFYPNSLTEKQRSAGVYFSCASEDLGWPFIDGMAAIAAIRTKFNMTFKNPNFN